MREPVIQSEESIATVLRWRLARAEAEAPAPPSAAALIARARPWWELWPERLETCLERLRAMPVAYGYAKSDAPAGRAGPRVAALVVHDLEPEVETTARVLYLSVAGARLRLRFELDADALRDASEVEVTFASGTRPLLAAQATAVSEHEFRLDARLPDGLARAWEPLKVTHWMPFRMILRVPGQAD